MFNKILHRYNGEDYLNFKKAEFLFIMIIAYSLLLMIVPFGFLSISMKRFLFTYLIVSPFVLINVVSLVFLIIKKQKISASIIAISCAVIESYLFLAREPISSLVSFSVLMIIYIVFATLYCPGIISGLITGSMIVLHIVHIKINSDATPETLALIQTANIDAILTIATIYIVCLFTSRFMEASLQKSLEKSKKNEEQYNVIKKMVNTVKTTIETLSNSVSSNFTNVEQLGTNAKNQAAAIEEISSTMEEIAANSQSVTGATKDQKSSIESLMESINVLSKSIDQNEIIGNELISQISYGVKLIEAGETATKTVNEINQKVSANSSNILSVVNIVEEFFDQINLLSLNASIEAARAGDHGRGFAVVAEEIGKLSDNSSQELQRIKIIIDNNRADVEASNKIYKEIVSFITNITENSREIQKKTEATIGNILKQKDLKSVMNEKAVIVKNGTELIYNAMTEQNDATNEITKTVFDTNNIVQDNVISTEN